MSPDKLVMMANQIAAFFHSQPGEGEAGVADHINAFWEPRMRAELLAIMDEEQNGLADLVVKARPAIRKAPSPGA